MKIIYASDAALLGDAANAVQVMKMCQAFSNNGHDVTLIARKGNRARLNYNQIFEWYSVKRNFKIHMAPYPKFKGRGIIYSFSAIRYIAQSKADLVYGRSMYICTLSAILLHLPVIFEIHAETSKKSKMGRMFSLLLKSRHLKRVVVISRNLSDYYQKEWGVPSEKIFVAHDGADIAEWSGECEIIDICSDGKNIGYFGSLYKGKGMELISEIALKTPEYRFHIFGGKEDEINYWKKVNESNTNVIFHGRISQKAVQKYGRQMDVLLAPYQSKVYLSLKNFKTEIGKYMSPLKLFEYMSFKKPIICTDLPVIREVIENGKDAFLCDADNPDEWVAAIREALSDSDRCRKMVNSAYDKLVSRYTWDKRAEKVIGEKTRI